MRKILLFAAIAVFVIGTVLGACAAHAAAVSRSAQAGAYSLDLKVLPAESFAGSDSEMVWEGGAKPDLLGATPKPNHHLVVFVKKDGKPVEDATVRIRYRRVGGGSSAWQTLPVVRMYERGKGRATMHYGNNVHLPAGNYAVRVKVNDAPAHLFHVTVAAD